MKSQRNAQFATGPQLRIDFGLFSSRWIGRKWVMCVTGSAQAEPSELAEGEMTMYLGLEGVGVCYPQC